VAVHRGEAALRFLASRTGRSRRDFAWVMVLVMGLGWYCNRKQRVRCGAVRCGGVGGAGKVGDPTPRAGVRMERVLFHSTLARLLSFRRQKPQPNKNTSSSEPARRARGEGEKDREGGEKRPSGFFLYLSGKGVSKRRRKQERLVGGGACELQQLLRRRCLWW
jgi:hypothetical protein